MQEERLKETQEQIAFAAADTVCFFAPFPEDLRKMQQREWKPVVDWVNANGCDFKISEGLDVQSLSERTKKFLEKTLNALSDEAFWAFCAVSGGCRSVILALAVLDGFMTAERAFDLSILEEKFQNNVWSEDQDALSAREGRKQDVLEAAVNLKGK